MDYSAYTNARPQWLQTQLQEPPHSQDERSQQRNDGSGEVMLGANEDVPGESQSKLCIESCKNDSVACNKVSAPNVSATVHSQSFYTLPPYPFSPYNNFIAPYGQQQQSSQWSVPLSTYSSLNGATSGQSSTQPQRSPVQQHQSPILQPQSVAPQTPQQYQPQQSQPQSQITIDPTLMLANYNNQPSHPTSGYPPAAYYSFSHTAPTLSLNPSLLHTPAQPSIPSNQANGSIAGPSSLPKSSLINVLNGLLAAKSLSNSPSQIVQTIIALGSSEVDLNLRLKVLSKIRDSAGNDFYQAWASNNDAMDIIRDWLKAAVTNKNGDWDETIMPLLHIIDRLPLTLESLKNSKLGKVVVKLKESSSNSAVKDMASNLELRWRTLLRDGKSPADGAKKSESRNVEEPRTKKRKTEEPQSKVVPPSKKLAVSRNIAPVQKPAPVVKREVKPVTAVKDSKSDSSFFSAPKPKPKLPSFKKAPPPVKKELSDLNIAQPSAVDPFKDALAAMKKARSSPVPMEITPVIPPSAPQTGPPGKKKKKVSFQTEDKLVEIRLIEPAVYDDDGVNGVYQAHNIKDLDRDEGAAMHKHIFEEQLDWSEPLPLEIPQGLDTPRGENSQEKEAQEEREKSALNALYMSISQIPDSPAEPNYQIPDDEVDVKVKPMLSGNDVRELDRSDHAATISVQGLISQLAGVGGVGGSGGVGGGGGEAVDTTTAPSQPPVPPLDLKQLGLDLNLIAQLQKAAQQPQAGGISAVNGFGFPPQHELPQPSYIGGGEQQQHQQTAAPPWNGQYNQDYGQGGGGGDGYDEDSIQRTKNWSSGGGGGQGWSGRGRGGGGRGGPRGGYRNNKRKLCNFFANGRCRYGDQCDFSHEL